MEVMKANFDGVANLIEFGLQHGMKRMVYISSGEVYGEGDGSEFSETSSGYVDCASVRACYPSSKRAAETLCMAYCNRELGGRSCLSPPLLSAFSQPSPDNP